MHWYDLEGNPKYEVPYAGKRKGMRPTTLRDARKLLLLPSVTEVMKVMDKPGLNRWLQDRVLESALTLPRNNNETDDIYKARIRQDSKEISTLAMNTGTEIHDACEQVFKHKSMNVKNAKHRNIALKVYDTVAQEIGDEWISEESFGCKLGFGGKVDLSKYNTILDFKTKEVLKPKMAFDEQLMQLVAYCVGLGYHIFETRFYNVFISWEGDIEIHEWKELDDITRAWDMFKACLNMWQLKHRYNPVKEIETKIKGETI